jgi:hypothetical protein
MIYFKNTNYIFANHIIGSENKKYVQSEATCFAENENEILIFFLILNDLIDFGPFI